MRRRAHRKVFGRIYTGREWGHGESASGPGSTLERTASLRLELPEVLVELGARTLLDAGCGDFNWLQAAELPVERYVGIDVVPELVADLEARYGGPGRAFLALDVTCDPLPAADVVLCRDTLIHFPDRDVFRALGNFRKSATWLLATTFIDRQDNKAIQLGDWRTLNLEVPPFDLPPPTRLIEDIPIVDRELYLDKRLGLWSL